jgi:hypothetical protein
VKNLIIIEGDTFENIERQLKKISSIYKKQGLPVRYINARRKKFKEAEDLLKKICTEGPDQYVLLFAGSNLNMFQYLKKTVVKRIDAEKLFSTTRKITELWVESKSKQESNSIQIALGAILSTTEGYDMKRFVPA